MLLHKAQKGPKGFKISPEDSARIVNGLVGRVTTTQRFHDLLLSAGIKENNSRLHSFPTNEVL